MKVAIVSFYMMETSLPLAKHLTESGIELDLYSLLPYTNQNTYVYDFLSNRQPLGFVNDTIVKKSLGNKLQQYLTNVNLKIFIFPSDRFQRLFLLDLFYAYKLAKTLKKKNYDIIHIIHNLPRIWLFLNLFIDKKKVIQTLHEVTSHSSETPFAQKLDLNILAKRSTPLIFPSKISQERFIDFKTKTVYARHKEQDMKVIRFGLFETFRCFSEQKNTFNGSGKIKILSFGRINPSKGIDILIDSVKILQDRYPIHLTVAGNGKPYFQFDGLLSYDFINRFLSNFEIVKLIEECDMVVLPYLSASQSGLPMTVFVFNKPIIASNVAGFKEIIEDLKTGIIVKELDPVSFANAIEALIQDKHLKAQMVENIKNKYNKGEFSWASIAEETIDFYKSHLT
jgi:glycosyltransferase involved in cell wall biosynthesis